MFRYELQPSWIPHIFILFRIAWSDEVEWDSSP